MQVLDKTQVEAVSKALGEPAWLLEKRLKALEAFARLPYPSKKDENWRYTDLSEAPLELPVEAPKGLRLSRDDLPEPVKRRLERTDVSGFLVFVGPDLVYAEVPEALKEKGLVFIGVHDSNAGWEKAQGVVNDKGINYPVAKDSGDSVEVISGLNAGERVVRDPVAAMQALAGQRAAAQGHDD